MYILTVKKKSFKKIVMLLLFSFSSLFSINNSLITEKLAKKIDTISENEIIEINIALKEQVDYQKLIHSSKRIENKRDRREFVINELKEFSYSTQEGILELLSLGKTKGNVKKVSPLWIANLINCKVTKEVISELSLRDDIRSIDYDEFNEGIIIGNIEELGKLKDEKISKNSCISEKSKTKDKSKETTWNVSQVNADEVWELGYDGTGVLVAIIDSGVNYNHQDLADHVWDGGDEYPNHGYDFANEDNDPMDDNAHGTHCAGTIAGDGTAGSQTGMAPNATLMCLKVLEDNGGGQQSDVWSAIEFAVENGADLISMSLGWPESLAPDYSTWRDAMNNVLAAGIIAAVASGNERAGGASAPNNCRTPGTVPPPWTSPDQTLLGGNSAVVCVGAIDIDNNIGDFSSFGPVTWEDVDGYGDYPYDPEMGLIRPDITAPGVNIKSLDFNSDTGYSDGWNGTSMATPCVAGVIALIMDKNRTLTPAQISQILEENVYNAQNPKNNDFGAGIIDALASINAIEDDGYPTVEITYPVEDEILTPDSIITIEVNASDEYKSVSLVEFFIDDTKIGEDTTEPYSFDWSTTGYSIGDHIIKVIATDDDDLFFSHEISVNVNYPFVQFFLEDFESTTEWTLTGEFEIGSPQGLGGISHGNPDPSSAVSGLKVLGVDLTDNGDYEPSLGDREYSAESRIIDCSSYSFVSLEFQRYLNIESASYDHAYIDIWDGTSWNEIFTNPEGIEDDEWVTQTIDISDYADGNYIKIRYSLGLTDGGWQLSGWNIDDVKLIGRPDNAIGDNYELAITNYELKQNYPNPFNPVTKISYRLPEKTMHASSLRLAEIVVYNAMGQMVWSSNPSTLNPNTCTFDGSKFNSGVYYYSLVVDGKNMDSKAMLLIK